MRRLVNGNIELTITVPWAKVQRAYEEVVDEIIKTTEIKGFRKGHVPKNLVEAKLDRNQTFSHALQHLLPKAYQEAVDKHSLKPVVYPAIRIAQGKEGEDWVFVATLCETPQDGKVPDMLVEQEVNRRLTILTDNLSRLGLTVDKYLLAKKLTAAELKAKLATEARHDLTPNP